MTPTSTPIQLVVGLISDIPAMLDKAKGDACRMIWDNLFIIIHQHWLGISGTLLLFWFLAFLVYVTTGRWAMLGSLMYHFLFGAGLFLVLWLFKPEFCANNIFELVTFLLYVVSFTIVHIWLVSSGIKRRW